MIQLIIIAFFIIVVSLALEYRRQLVKAKEEEELNNIRYKFRKIIRKSNGDISSAKLGATLTYKGVYDEKKKRQYTNGDVVTMKGNTYVYYKKIWHELI